MKKIEGLRNYAIVYADTIEESAIDQIKELCNQEFLKNSKIRIMPDVHLGIGCTIGTTMTVNEKTVPNLVGVDIGCGIETAKISNREIELYKLDEIIRREIPTGSSIRKVPHIFNEKIDLNKLYCAKNVNINRAIKSIGTLGGGNHFIEVSKDDEDSIYIIVHSGSRNLGSQVARHYQREAYKRIKSKQKRLELGIRKAKEELKEHVKYNEARMELEKLVEEESVIKDLPKDLAFIEDELFKKYIHDMRITQEYAKINREAILDVILKEMKLDVVSKFTTTHNYIDTESMILRKGAVSAKKGEELLIPINMRDGSLLCIGKGNSDWNYSAPHGAGRLMSRRKAMEEITLSEFKESMEGIYTSTATGKTKDEAPMAYKSMREIEANISETAEIIKILKPIFNFKDS